MRERLDVLRHALHDLDGVHADLRRRVVTSMGESAPEAPPNASPSTPGACQRCRLEDAIVTLRVCMRCTDVARGEGARWMSGEPGPSAATAVGASGPAACKGPPR
jgi:hypothetical protein